MSIEFARWWPLLGLVAVPFIWRLSQHSTLGSSARHRAVAAGVRMAVVVLLVGALIEPVWHRSGKWLSHWSPHRRSSTAEHHCQRVDVLA